MRRTVSVPRPILVLALFSVAVVAYTTSQVLAQNAKTRWSHQDWPTGHYRVVEGWPKPLPDTRHSHDGWTWGSFGGVYAENPDRIWIAMRGELPLPAGAEPWTPYAALNPSRGNADRQWRRHHGDVPAGAEARMGAPLTSTRSIILESAGRSGRRVAASRQDVRASCPADADRIRSKSARTTRRSTSGSSMTSCT